MNHDPEEVPMPRQFIWPAGGAYPATLADFKRAKAGEKAKARSVEVAPGATFTPAYAEVVPSLLANGCEEVKSGGVPER